MKKSIAIILAMLMLCTQIPAFAAFSDITADFSWAEEAINEYADRGIVAGKGDNMFAPQDGVTGEELTKMACLALNIAPVEDFGKDFANVTQDMWSYKYFCGLYNYYYGREGIDNLPEISVEVDSMTRADVARVLVSIVGHKGKDVLDTDVSNISFPDTDEEYVKLASKYGIVLGYDDGTFKPDALVNRAEAIIMLKRTETVMKKISDALGETPTPAPTATVNPTPTPSETPTVSPSAVKPKSENDLLVVEKVTQGIVDGITYDKVYYCYKGVVAEEPLLMAETGVVKGARGKIGEVKPGDICTVDLSGKGYVRTLWVFFKAGTEVPTSKQESATFFNDMIAIPKQADGSTPDHGIYGSGEKNEYYFGYITEVKTRDNGFILKTVGADGNFATGAQSFLLNDSVSVYEYQAYSKSSNDLFKKIDAADIGVSTFTKNNSGDIDFTDGQFDAGDMCYCFVKVYKDNVTDVVVINYNR